MAWPALPRGASAEHQRRPQAGGMTAAETDRLIRGLVGGDAVARRCIVQRAQTSDDPLLLVAAALVDPGAADPLRRALQSATCTRDRQIVAIAAAHLAGDRDRVDALARDHLVDHPESILVAWIAAAWTGRPPVDNHPTQLPGKKERS
jgi:hypothetical protein